MGVAKPPSTHSSTTDSALPGICKELIGQSVANLRGCNGTEESMADRLASDLNLVYASVQTISDLYDSLDDDSQENGEYNVYNEWEEEQTGTLVLTLSSLVFKVSR